MKEGDTRRCPATKARGRSITILAFQRPRGLLFHLGGQSLQIPNDDIISMKNLKKIVRERFPEDSPFRRVILIEKDYITRKQFQEKIPMWNELLTMEI